MPANVVELKGADKKDPQRFRDRKVSESAAEDMTGKLRSAPEHLDARTVLVWEDVRKTVPWLRDADCFLIESTVKLITKMQYEPEEMKAADYSNLRAMLGQLGMTPADRSKVNIVPEPKKEDDPWANM